jgi:hypothetical protein
LVAQALSNFETVYRVRPIKVVGHEFGFVALDGADAVPHQWVTTALQRGDFVDAFLDVVFAKVTLAAGSDLAHIIGAESFGHGEQLHAVGASCTRGTSGSDAGLYSMEVIS